MPALATVTVLITALLCIPACSLSGDREGGTRTITFLPSGTAIKAEVADTDATRQKGLMYRTHLDEQGGMIFYFDQLSYHSFYMYNTRIPLSVIFLDGDLRIVDVQDMEPCLEESPAACKVYTPKAACQYVVEVNQSFVRKHGIKVGDVVKVQE